MITKFTLFSLSAASVSAIRTLERDLQTCPEPDGTPCILESDPVKCGQDACEYDNQCIANAAGFTPGICWPATCADPDPSVPCTNDNTTVICGDSACPYANYCTAGAAGFPATVCEAADCPVPDDGACILEFNPQVCLVEGIGLCRYENLCFAGLAGLDPDSGRCLPSNEYISNVMGECPVVASDAICPLIYEPVICDGCYYANACEATSAGFDPEDRLTCQSAFCPEPAEGIACTADENPVYCFDGCAYSNECLASAAGYWTQACVPYSCPVPDPETVCSREYDPVICTAESGEECEYDNECLAGAAGQSDCAIKNDPENPEDCPLPSPDSTCTLEIDQVVCGENDCFYGNQCQATSAGFNAVECRNPSCPRATDVVESCGDFDPEPLVCGPYKCPYLSECTANRAGWVGPTECTPEVCPQPPAGSLCTTEYDPIICVADDIANGVPCPYVNECNALQAGFEITLSVGQCYKPGLSNRAESKAIESDGEPDVGPGPNVGPPNDGGDEELEVSSATIQSILAAATTAILGIALM